MDSPLRGNDMLPTVVTPPANAARVPISKLSAQLFSPGPVLGGVKCTWGSTPPGNTNIPFASMD